MPVSDPIAEILFPIFGLPAAQVQLLVNGKLAAELLGLAVQVLQLAAHAQNHFDAFQVNVQLVVQAVEHFQVAHLRGQVAVGLCRAVFREETKLFVLPDYGQVEVAAFGPR